ncbi:hypothetical protein BO86DRAFT_419963 [Aspergillus japonicus CBS 114.51]|uniref:WSC domain-containing protein n=2 Tax=Aspergillus TaxID=5052 RepID=A0A2V5HG83_ASPV1|nr:hypothetical protein BO86DRAFT_419963 [Aspergillus japonicus CBS 114.51]PYI14990.1 hypothetical protein BO99DRAFT_469003 [Aspergillus violaceofuscus CBS 115571]RAH80437.1 hypothetical protein BO86DRAFT_419963 [Aspergillus japonicus CBS 114.51]
MRAHFVLPSLLGAIALLAWPVSVSSSITYCSSVNTGSSQAANESTFQSNGLCEDHCSSYAFGILQGYDCWCSNIAPNSATNVNNSKCSQDCPGYPDDSCGSTSKGLYAYVEVVGNQPSGTATVSSTSTTSTSVSKSLGRYLCDRTCEGCALRGSLGTQFDQTSSTQSSSTTSAATTTTGQTVSTETNAGGTVKTVTRAASQPTATASSTGTTSKSTSSSGMSSGTIAGIVVGSIGGALAIIALLFVLFFAKRNQRASSPDPSVQNILLDGRQSKGSQMSFMKGMFSDNHSHTLSAGSSIAAHRLPTFTDNRMKTDTVLFANGRRDSDASLQDNEDYSRPVLRLTNPD